MANIELFKEASLRSISRGALLLKKHSPAILTGAGILSGAASTVLASKATLKLEETIDGIRTALEIAESNREKGLNDPSVAYTQSDYTKDVSYIYARGGLKVLKLYGPALSMGAAAITCVISAQGIMQRRNVALTAMVAAVEKGFSEYRKRVEDELGPEKEEELYYGVSKKEYISEETKEKEVLVTYKAESASVYARFFDELSPEWSPIPEYNLMKLKAVQNYSNDRLRARGYVFLNEIYEQLGIPQSPAGQIVGWLYNDEGDNFIDFKVYDVANQDKRAFVNGKEPAILLDFNVDGPIYDKI